MKNLIKSFAGLVTVLSLFVSLTGTVQNKVFKVDIKWPGGDGKKLILTTNRNGLPITLDSTRVVNGAAVLSMPAPDRYTQIYLGINNVYLQEILAYEGTVTAEITNSSESQAGSTIKIKGSLEQDLYQEYNNIFSTGLMTNMMRTRALKKIGDDPVKKDSIMKHYQPAFDSLLHVQDYIVTKYSDKDIAGYMLSRRVSSYHTSEQREEQFSHLSDRVKKGPYGLAIQKIMKDIVNREIGRPAYQFTAMTKDSKKIKLSDYKGKYVILDFWSSTCGPCLRMAPYVKQLYDTYRAKGFEIIAISLDTKKEDWVAAMQKHEISGVQVSSLKGPDDPIAEYYGIFQMPAMVLIDPKGNNAGLIDPKRLDIKLAEIFKKD